MRVLVNDLICLAANLDEVVHVELSVEGAVVLVLEVLGQHNISEFGDALDGKGIPFGRPADDPRVLRSLSNAGSTSRI